MQQRLSIRYLHEGKPGWLMTAREAVQLIGDEDTVALRFVTNEYKNRWFEGQLSANRRRLNSRSSGFIKAKY